ncbi:MAG: cobalamin B12-binding domain-containing protein [Candidatus Omnitrophica bacterium]|nr:cobalamin B12-binding domain-containing protein [Candidatus Omnitrophota bacterium]
MTVSSACDLLLINPGGRKKVYQDLAAELAAVEPPVWVGLIAAFIRQKGFSVRIVDANADNLSSGETAQAIVDANPTLAAVVVYGHQPSASTQTMPAAGAICRETKQLNPAQKMMLVGGHVAALPERTLREEAADYVSGGEGPVTVWQLLEALRSPAPDLGKVLGLCYWDRDAVRLNPPAPLIKDLDHELPGMAWDLLDLSKYRAHNWHCFGGRDREPYACLYTTLGCPFHCSFCCIQAPFKTGERVLGYKESVNSYRYWSPQNIIRQIDYLVERYGVKNFKFADEMFVLNKSHVLGICDLIIERKYDLNIWAYARIDTCEESMLAKLRQAGFTWLGIGVESASQYVRDGVEKNFGKRDILKTLDRVRQAGINIGANFIFGLPDDTLETMRDTLDLALEICPDWANFYCAMAYPGSRLYDLAVEKGWDLPESWIGYSQHSFETLPLRTERLTAGEVLRFRDQAFQIFFSDPGYLRYVEGKFGEETARHIRQMTSRRLERKYA